MTLPTVFRISVVLYTVSNMASLGLELNLRETMTSLRSVRLVVLTLAVFTAFPVQDPGTLVMLLLSGPVPAILSLPLARTSRPGRTRRARR